MEQFYIEKLNNFYRFMNNLAQSKQQKELLRTLDPHDEEKRRLFTGWITLVIEPIRKDKDAVINEVLNKVGVKRETIWHYQQMDLDRLYEYLYLFCEIISGRLK